MRSFHVLNLGCKVNRVESDDFAARLLAQGKRAVPAREADVIIVNTCAVTGEAEKKTRKAVRQALRANQGARVVVTGCAAALDAETFRAMDERVQVVSKPGMLEVLGQLAGDGQRTSHRLPASSPVSQSTADAPSSLSPSPSQPSLIRPSCGHDRAAVPTRVGEGFPTRVGLKVQDGCNNACSFCIVHVARGQAWSRPVSEVLDEAVRLAQAGAREIVLTGINLGSYSYEGASLSGLLRRLLEACEDLRFRVSSIEPCDVSDDLISLLRAAEGRICRHLHLPLQSGSSKVLREMRRPYRAEHYRALVERLYEAVPSLSLSTDVIAGFPGESEEDFEATEEMARVCRFSKMHVFRYSMREGTPAAARTDQVPAQIKAERAKRLEDLGRHLAAADLKRRAGTRELALVETGGVATTESYHTLEAPEGAGVGELVEVVL